MLFSDRASRRRGVRVGVTSWMPWLSRQRSVIALMLHIKELRLIGCSDKFVCFLRRRVGLTLSQSDESQSCETWTGRGRFREARRAKDEESWEGSERSDHLTMFRSQGRGFSSYGQVFSDVMVPELNYVTPFSLRFDSQISEY